MDGKKINLSNTFLSEPWFRYSVMLVLIFSFISYFKLYYSEIIQLPFLSNLNLYRLYPEFITNDDVELNQSFIDWAGILFGLSIPLVLLKTVERFEALEKYFDKEAVSLKIFIDWVLLLPDKQKARKKKILLNAIEYTAHVRVNYIHEAYQSKIKRDGNAQYHRQLGG